MSFISRVSGVVTEAKIKVIAITLISRQVSVLPEPLLQSATLRAVCKALDYILGQRHTHAFIL